MAKGSAALGGALKTYQVAAAASTPTENAGLPERRHYCRWCSRGWLAYGAQAANIDCPFCGREEVTLSGT